MRDPEIRLNRDCAVSTERLWEVLVTPSLWWGAEVRLEPRAGGVFHEPWRDSAGAHDTRGEVVAYEPSRRLGLSWRDDDWTFDTHVTFELAEKGEGSRLLLCHGGWKDAPQHLQDRLLSSHRQGWTHHLDNLVACAERAP